MPDCGLVERDGVLVHPSACVDQGCAIGPGTMIWHFTHVTEGAQIGRDCMLAQGVFVGAKARIGDRVRIQNHVSVFDGVLLEDDVFVGPSATFTNVKHPRVGIRRRPTEMIIRVRQGASIGANATIMAGVDVGPWAVVGAGAVVTRSVADHALVVGAPARQTGWVGRRGLRLRADGPGRWRCPESDELYVERGPGLGLMER